MTRYVSRIPVDDEYADMLGHVLYNFAYAEWVVVYLGSLIDPSFLRRGAGNDSRAIADAFTTIVQGTKSLDLIALADRFHAAEVKRVEFLRATPITGALGAQILYDSGASPIKQWTLEEVTAYAEELEGLAIDGNALYYKTKPSS